MKPNTTYSSKKDQYVHHNNSADVNGHFITTIEQSSTFLPQSLLTKKSRLHSTSCRAISITIQLACSTNEPATWLSYSKDVCSNTRTLLLLATWKSTFSLKKTTKELLPPISKRNIKSNTEEKWNMHQLITMVLSLF